MSLLDESWFALNMNIPWSPADDGFAATSAAREEAAALANVLGEEGDILRFENVTFTVDGILAGAAYSLPLTARGTATIRSTELRLVAEPPLLPPVHVKLREIGVLEMEKPVFEPRRLRAHIERSGSLCVETSLPAATDALYQELKNITRVLREAPAPLPRLRRSGVHIALVDPTNPSTLTLTELLEQIEEELPSQ